MCVKQERQGLDSSVGTHQICNFSMIQDRSLSGCSDRRHESKKVRSRERRPQTLGCHQARDERGKQNKVDSLCLCMHLPPNRMGTDEMH
jgi:hypothetical protein